MIDELKTDCRHFRWDRPCAPHKQTGAICGSCDQYDAVVSRIAVVKLAAVGDVLRTTSFLTAIRKVHPGCWITWVTDESAVDLFAGNSLVDAVLTPDAPELWVQEFDVVMCPDTDPRTVAVAAAIDGAERVGFTAGPRGTVQPLNGAAEHWLSMGVRDDLKRANEETYQSLVARVLEIDPAEVTEPILEPADEHREVAGQIVSDLGNRIVGINTGAGARWLRKRWPLPHQASFAKAIVAGGASVLLLGGPEEDDAHAELESLGDGIRSAGTHHDFRQFAALVERCDVLVTGDTLALHVACARKVPVVALFGPTSLPEIELYGRGVKLAAEDLDCLGCYLPTCDVDPHCQERITPELVAAAVWSLLG